MSQSPGVSTPGATSITWYQRGTATIRARTAAASTGSAIELQLQQLGAPRAGRQDAQAPAGPAGQHEALRRLLAAPREAAHDRPALARVARAEQRRLRGSGALVVIVAAQQRDQARRAGRDERAHGEVE